MTGLQKAAWWSVPLLGVVAIACASTLGVLFAIRPPLTTQPSQEKRVADVNERAAPKENQQPTTNTEADSPAEPDRNIKTVTNVPVIHTPPGNREINPVSLSAAAPKANVLASLHCAGGKIHFEGSSELNFVSQQPSFKTTEEGSNSFEFLSFNGADQSIELPDVLKKSGSIELVCKMPGNGSSIVLDNSFQRLTIRKNNKGFRWRIDANKKTNKIKLSPGKVDFSQWQHVVITWSETTDAILYMNGIEQDRMAYENEQPHFANFEKMVLGKTRGPDGRFFESEVHRYKVFDQPMTSAEIVAQYDELKSSFPFIFK